MNNEETYTVFSNIIKKYQNQNPLEYKELFLKCPSLKINLNNTAKEFIIQRNESCYFGNGSVCRATLILCGVEYKYANWWSNPSVLYYRCCNDLYRQRNLAEFNIANANYKDCSINRYFINLVLTKLFQMTFTYDYSCLTFPNPFYKENDNNAQRNNSNNRQ